MLFPLGIMIDHIIDGDIDGNTDGDDHGKKAHNVVPTGESEILMATMMQGMPISYTLCSINDH